MHTTQINRDWFHSTEWAGLGLLLRIQLMPFYRCTSFVLSISLWEKELSKIEISLNINDNNLILLAKSLIILLVVHLTGIEDLLYGCPWLTEIQKLGGQPNWKLHLHVFKANWRETTLVRYRSHRRHWMFLLLFHLGA